MSCDGSLRGESYVGEVSSVMTGVVRIGGADRRCGFAGTQVTLFFLVVLHLSSRTRSRIECQVWVWLEYLFLKPECTRSIMPRFCCSNTVLLPLLWRASSKLWEFQRQPQLRDGMATALRLCDLEFVAVGLGGYIESAAQLREVLLDSTPMLAFDE